MFHGEGAAEFSWKSIWKVKTLLKVASFVRLAASGKILPMENLQWQGVILVNWCCMCKQDRESVDHLLLHCSMARELWALALSLFGIHWVMPKRMADFWKGRFDRHHSRGNWNAIPLCNRDNLVGKEWPDI